MTSFNTVLHVRSQTDWAARINYMSEIKISSLWWVSIQWDHLQLPFCYRPFAYIRTNQRKIDVYKYSSISKINKTYGCNRSSKFMNKLRCTLVFSRFSWDRKSKISKCRNISWAPLSKQATSPYLNHWRSNSLTHGYRPHYIQGGKNVSPMKRYGVNSRIGSLMALADRNIYTEDKHVSALINKIKLILYLVIQWNETNYTMWWNYSKLKKKLEFLASNTNGFVSITSRTNYVTMS